MAAHLLPIPCSVTPQLHLEISHGGCIYTMEIASAINKGVFCCFCFSESHLLNICQHTTGFMPSQNFLGWRRQSSHRVRQEKSGNDLMHWHHCFLGPHSVTVKAWFFLVTEDANLLGDDAHWSKFQHRAHGTAFQKKIIPVWVLDWPRVPHLDHTGVALCARLLGRISTISLVCQPIAGSPFSILIPGDLP